MTASTTVNAYAAASAGAALEPFQYEVGALAPDEVEIAVEHCGICHSDLSMWKNDWNMSVYPFVGGHEAAGRVAAIGEKVRNVKVGDKVGLGWHKGYCKTCHDCLIGDHNICADQAGTIVDNHGGFADRVRAQDLSVIKIPDALDLADAGPLLCAGITVFNPLVQFDVEPTDHVAVIGIGGLGHLALQFARAWGCEVTAFTSESKMEKALAMGAHHCVNSRDRDAIKAARMRFDIILSTVNVSMDWAAILETLRPRGRLHLLGAVGDPLEIPAFGLIGTQRSVSGSPVGSPVVLEMMMEFAARHAIKPVVERFAMADVNDAFEHLESGRARYRIVLDQA
jgi:uncharacterized zinc-type alcohol dehydrogenase-like protein